MPNCCCDQKVRAESAQFHMVATSNNRDHALRSLHCCSFAHNTQNTSKQNAGQAH